MIANIQDYQLRRTLAVARIERVPLTQLSQTRIRFKVGLKNSTIGCSINWQDVLPPEDAEKGRKSEVNWQPVVILKSLKQKNNEIRYALKRISNLVFEDQEGWIVTGEYIEKVWLKLREIEEKLIPEAREKILQEYESDLQEYIDRIDNLLKIEAWKLSEAKAETIKQKMVAKFPAKEDVNNFLRLEVSNIVIIPGIEEQLEEKQQEVIEQIKRYARIKEQFNIESLRHEANQTAKSIITDVLSSLEEWNVGNKPKKIRGKIENYLERLNVLKSLGSESESNIHEAIEQLNQVNWEQEENPERLGELISKLKGEKEEIEQIISATPHRISTIALMQV